VSTVKDLHREAMQRADQAHASRRTGDAVVARKHFAEAYSLERRAAEELSNRYDAEPSRSILFRSAAALALEAGAFAEAEQMVCAALAGTPPADIAEELRDLFEQINFRRHLSLRGIELTDREVQMSIAGPGVGYGMAPTEAVIERIEHTQALLYRFAERKLRMPYRARGAPPKEIRQAVSLFMTVPRAASYAVSLVVGGPQEYLPGMSAAESVVDEVLDCLDLFVRDEEEALHEKIPDEDYLTNFKGLARAIAPDGDEVQTVGFTAVRAGQERTVALRPVRRGRTPMTPEKREAEKTKKQVEVTVTGILLFADATKQQQNLIKLVEESGLHHSILVPPGMMDDIVRPLWDYRVTVTGVPKGRNILLTDIIKARD
jgi:hypothetical protein